MKKIILIVLSVVLVAAACQKKPVQQSPDNQNNNQASSTDTSKLPQGNKEGWQTYANSQFGFEIKYPNNFKLYTDLSQTKTLSFVPPCDDNMVACLFYSKDNEKDTNYEGGGMSLNKTGAVTENACLVAGNGEKRVGNEVINGVTYTVFEGGNAATGHWEILKLYRTFRSGVCLEANLRISGYSRGNLPDPDKVRELNRNDVWAKFTQVLSTLKFSNTTILSAPPASTPAKKPVAEGKVWVDFGAAFTLKKNSRVYFNSSDEYLELTGFYYEPCPENAQCSWSGLDYYYKFYANGKTYTKAEILQNPLANTPYTIMLTDSDYKTYATFVVTKISN
jgi:hypothetical protein